MLVDILYDDDARRGHADDVVPPVGAVEIAVPDRRRRGAADARGDRVPDHRGQLRKEAPQTAVSESFVAQPDVERLDGVRHRRPMEAPVLFDQLRCQDRHVGTLLFRRIRRGARIETFVSEYDRRERDGLCERACGRCSERARRREVQRPRVRQVGYRRESRDRRGLNTVDGRRRLNRRHWSDRHPFRRTVDVFRKARRVRRGLELLADPGQPRHAHQDEDTQQREQRAEPSGVRVIQHSLIILL